MLNTIILDKLQASSTEKAKEANPEKPINPYAFRDAVQHALRTIGKAFVIENEKDARDTELGHVCMNLRCCPAPSAELFKYLDSVYIYCGSSRIVVDPNSLEKYIEALTTVRDELKTLEAKMQEMASKVDFTKSSDDDDDDDDDDWD